MGDPFNDEFKLLEGDPHDLTAALTLSRVAVYPIDSRGLAGCTAVLRGNEWSACSGCKYPVRNRPGVSAPGIWTRLRNRPADRAYYNSNGLGAKITEIENNGSSYYTLTYATTNQNWNGELRHIKVELKQAHGKLQYRQGYFAVDRSKQEQKQLDDLKNGKADGDSQIAENSRC